MRILKITYTVQASYVEHNKENINRVMDELRASGRDDIRYSAFLEADGKTFVHLVIRKDAQSEGMENVQAFKIFQSELKASQPEKPPVSMEMTLVGSVYDLF